MSNRCYYWNDTTRNLYSYLNFPVSRVSKGVQQALKSVTNINTILNDKKMICETKGRLDGKVVIVTGGSSGIGYEAAKNVANRGARVIIASRNETKLINARDKIRKETRNEQVDYQQLDLGSFQSVRQFSNEILQSESRLDVLVNNAGAVGLPDTLTKDGVNLSMQVNYFGTFLLTYLLLPLLKSSAPSRIINGSAATMYIGVIDFDHWNDIGRYSTIASLANSKLADYLFTVELDRRLKGTGVTANSFDPFVVSDTGILDNLSEGLKNIAGFFTGIIGQSKEELGKQIAYLAAEPSLEDVSGKHYKFCGEWLKHWLGTDVELTRELWEKSKQVVNITPKEDWETNSI